jgi:hypothetical protein
MKKIHGKAKRFLLSVKILYLLNKILTIDFTGEMYMNFFNPKIIYDSPINPRPLFVILFSSLSC